MGLSSFNPSAATVVTLLNVYSLPVLKFVLLESA